MSAIKVVARFTDGRVVKGSTQDFFPNKDAFHVHEEKDGGGRPVLIERDSLKALFFVKSYAGNRDHDEVLAFDNAGGQGRKMKVTFEDGEILTGFTMGFSRERPGFFLFPTDPKSNNERIFVVLKAVAAVEPVV